MTDTFSTDQGQSNGQDTDQPRFNNQNEPDNSSGQDNSQDQEAFVEVNGRKYSKEDVAKKIENADEHINKLESENQKVRTDAEKLMDKVDELGQRVPKLEEALESAFYNTEGRKPDVDVEEVVSRTKNETLQEINNQKAQEEYNANIQNVSAKLQEAFGENPDEEVFRRAAEVGYSKDEAFELAGKKPAAFLKLIGVSESRKGPSTDNPNSELKTEALRNKQDNKSDKLPSMLNENTTKGRINAFTERLEAKKQELGIS